jgi:hypothetical protein
MLISALGDNYNWKVMTNSRHNIALQLRIKNIKTLKQKWDKSVTQ